MTLEVCDDNYCSGPASIIVAVNGINDNPPVISVMPSGEVSTVLRSKIMACDSL